MWNSLTQGGSIAKNLHESFVFETPLSNVEVLSKFLESFLLSRPPLPKVETLPKSLEILAEGQSIAKISR